MTDFRPVCDFPIVGILIALIPAPDRRAASGAIHHDDVVLAKGFFNGRGKRDFRFQAGHVGLPGQDK